ADEDRGERDRGKETHGGSVTCPRSARAGERVVLADAGRGPGRSAGPRPSARARPSRRGSASHPGRIVSESRAEPGSVGGSSTVDRDVHFPRFRLLVLRNIRTGSASPTRG